VRQCSSSIDIDFRLLYPDIDHVKLASRPYAASLKVTVTTSVPGKEQVVKCCGLPNPLNEMVKDDVPGFDYRYKDLTWVGQTALLTRSGAEA